MREMTFNEAKEIVEAIDQIVYGEGHPFEFAFRVTNITPDKYKMAKIIIETSVKNRNK